MEQKTGTYEYVGDKSTSLERNNEREKVKWVIRMDEERRVKNLWQAGKAGRNSVAEVLQRDCLVSDKGIGKQ